MPAALESGFFTYEPAWHKCGTVIQRPVTTTAEAIELAGLNWEVISLPLHTVINGESIPVDSHKINVRSTDYAKLGVVTNGYTILQNKEAFGFFDPLLETGDYQIDTAGSLCGGKKIWVLVKAINNTQDILKNDPVDNYILLSNSHDGTMAVTVALTPIRVVCQNTLSYSINKAARCGGKYETDGALTFNKKIARRRHTAGMSEGLSKIQAMIDLSSMQFSQAVDQYKLFAKTELSIEQARAYFERVFELEAKGEEKVTPQKEQKLSTLLGLYDSLPDIEHCRGTLWAAYNTASYYNQYERASDNASGLNNLWFGAAQKTLTKAHDEALILI